ncbi:hypothetical protein GWI33_007339 [Rhynchophorus ferrugineus]|uniref:Uncharacterized protein n=1 Tax=Rhynchophorus ferrugineus TaxID=354439 RepID=A0A834II02_RHYFE|nr:hypothetical protein GWI33_007339 [Rhynchophorus ferrugineus]
MDKKEFRVLIKYCFLKEKTIVETKTGLDAESPDTNPGKYNIKDWVEFNRPRNQETAEGRNRKQSPGRSSPGNDRHPSGLPHPSATPTPK